MPRIIRGVFLCAGKLYVAVRLCQLSYLSGIARVKTCGLAPVTTPLLSRLQSVALLADECERQWNFGGQGRSPSQTSVVLAPLGLCRSLEKRTCQALECRGRPDRGVRPWHSTTAIRSAMSFALALLAGCIFFGSCAGNLSSQRSASRDDLARTAGSQNACGKNRRTSRGFSLSRPRLRRVLCATDAGDNRLVFARATFDS